MQQGMPDQGMMPQGMPPQGGAYQQNGAYPSVGEAIPQNTPVGMPLQDIGTDNSGSSGVTGNY